MKTEITGMKKVFEDLATTTEVKRLNDKMVKRVMIDFYIFFFKNLI